MAVFIFVLVFHPGIFLKVSIHTYTYTSVFFFLACICKLITTPLPRPCLHPNICTQHVRDSCVSLKKAPLAIVTCLTHCMLLLYICRSAPAFPCRAPDNQIFAVFTRAPPSLPRLTCWILASWIIDRRSDGLWGACLCLNPPQSGRQTRGSAPPVAGDLMSDKRLKKKPPSTPLPSHPAVATNVYTDTNNRNKGPIRLKMLM